MPSVARCESFINMKLFEIRVGILQKWVIFLVISDILVTELFLVREKHK